MLKKTDFLILILIMFMVLAGVMAYMGSSPKNGGKVNDACPS